MLLKRDQGGFAVVYGLVVLFLATLAGMSLMYMSRKDKESSSDYSKMRDAAIAARTALSAFEGQFGKNSDLAVATIDSFCSDTKYRWFFASSATLSSSEKRKYLRNDNGSPSFSARIMKYDSVNYLIQVEGIGYGGHGGKKRAIGIYKLEGVKNLTASAGTPKHALYLGGASQNFNGGYNITGDVYFSMNWGDQSINGNAAGIINGNFKTGDSNNRLQVNGNLTINGNAYVRTPMNINSGTVRVNGISGFQKEFTALNTQMKLNGDAYFNSTYPYNWNSNVDMLNHIVKYNPAINSGKFVNTKAGSGSQSNIDIASKVGMTNTNEAPVAVNMPSFPAGVVKNVSGDITGEQLDALYNSNSGSLYNGEWLVVRTSGWVNMKGGNFTKKVIWLVDANGINSNSGQSWYNCSDESNTMVYATGGSFNMYLADNYKFRGYLYNNSTSSTIYQFGNNTIFNGAIHHSLTSNFCINGGTLNLQYGENSSGQSALQEFGTLGIVIPPGGSGVPGKTIALIDTRVRPRLLGVYY